MSTVPTFQQDLQNIVNSLKQDQSNLYQVIVAINTLLDSKWKNMSENEFAGFSEFSKVLSAILPQIVDIPALENTFLAFGAAPSEKMSEAGAALLLDTIASKVGKTFDPCLVKISELEGEMENIKQYFEYVSAAMQSGQIQPPINKTFVMLGDPHWLCIQAEFTMQNGVPKMNLLFLDSVPGMEVVQDLIPKFIKASEDAFDAENITIYDSKLPLQADGSRCSLYAIMFARKLHSLIFGKFNKLLFDFNLFAELAKTNMTEPKRQIDGVQVCEVRELPAKILQMSGYIPNNPDVTYNGTQVRDAKITIPIICRAWNAVVNSTGRTLGAVIEAHNTQTSFIKDTSLAKYAKKWFAKMTPRVQDELLNVSDATVVGGERQRTLSEKIAHIMDCKQRYSTASLPKPALQYATPSPTDHTTPSPQALHFDKPAV